MVTWGLGSLLAGIVSLIAALEAGAGPEVVTVPLLLAGLGVGALASQLGAVTVSAAPDEQSGDVGGLQNTATNLGASFGTALAGSILIVALSSTLLTGISGNETVSDEVTAAAEVEITSGVPFVSDADLADYLDEAGVPQDEAAAIVDENEDARIAGLRLSLAVLGLMAAVAMFLTRLLPTTPIGGPTSARQPASGAPPTSE